MILFKNIVKNVLNKYFSNYIVYSIKSSTNDILITFDDGPSPYNTELILDVLKNKNVKACFFVLGSNAEKHPEIINRIYKEGHDIGVHGYDHYRASKIPAKKYIDGVLKTNEIIEGIINEKIHKIFRPPYGDITLLTLSILLFKGYKYIMWNYNSNDSFVKDNAALLNYIFNNIPDSGSICLFHDDYKITSQTLAEIIDHWKMAGYKFKSLS